MLLQLLFALSSLSADPSANSNIVFATQSALSLTDQNYAIKIQLQKSNNDTQFSLSSLFFENNKSRLANQTCHLHQDHLDCEETSLIDVTNITSHTLAFTNDHFITSLNESLESFELKVSDSSAIYEIQSWQTAHDIWVKYFFHIDGTARTQTYSCHVHGSHFDCHRKLKDGPGNPF